MSEPRSGLNLESCRWGSEAYPRSSEKLSSSELPLADERPSGGENPRHHSRPTMFCKNMELNSALTAIWRCGQQTGYYCLRFSQTRLGAIGTACFARVPYPPPTGGGLIEAKRSDGPGPPAAGSIRRPRAAASLKHAAIAAAVERQVHVSAAHGRRPH